MKIRTSVKKLISIALILVLCAGLAVPVVGTAQATSRQFRPLWSYGGYGGADFSFSPAPISYEIEYRYWYTFTVNVGTVMTAEKYGSWREAEFRQWPDPIDEQLVVVEDVDGGWLGRKTLEWNRLSLTSASITFDTPGLFIAIGEAGGFGITVVGTAPPQQPTTRSPENQAMLDMIIRTNGSRSFVDFNHPMTYHQVITTRPAGGAIHIFQTPPPAGTSYWHFMNAYSQALVAMLNGESGITQSHDSSAADDALIVSALGLISPSISVIYTTGTLISDINSLNLGIGRISYYRDIELLILLHANSESGLLEWAIEELLARDYYHAIREFLVAEELALRGAQQGYIGTIVGILGGPLGKYITTLLKIADIQHSIDSRRNEPPVRIHAIQGIREAVWQTYDEIAVRVLAGDFTEDDLVTARNLFAMSSYLAEEQLWWLRPMLDGSGWGALVLANQRGTWDNMPIIQNNLRDIRAIQQNPALYGLAGSAVGAGAGAGAILATPRVILDGAPLAMDVPPQIIGGRTMVPMRAIFEALDAEVRWDGAKQTATGTRDDTTVVLPIGSTSPTVNGSVVTIDAPGVVIDGRTLVPLRFVAESFGVDVNWDGATRTVTINSAA